MMTVAFVTDDGVTVVGSHYPAAPGGGALDRPSRYALLLHMMPATKESWRPLAEELAARGVDTLAIDLRGHGESVRGEGGATLDFTAFDDAAHGRTSFDIEAAVRWLQDRGMRLSELTVVGASIGANLGLRYVADHPDIPAVAALSPGLNYRGVTADDAVSLISPPRRMLLAASADDPRAYADAKSLASARPEATVYLLREGGHGTAMLERDPGFFRELLDWIAPAA